MATFNDELLEDELDLDDDQELVSDEDAEGFDDEFDEEYDEDEDGEDDEYDDEEYDDEEEEGGLSKKALFGIIGACAAVFLCLVLFLGTRLGKNATDTTTDRSYENAGSLFTAGSYLDDPTSLYIPGDLDPLFARLGIDNPNQQKAIADKIKEIIDKADDAHKDIRNWTDDQWNELFDFIEGILGRKLTDDEKNAIKDLLKDVASNGELAANSNGGYTDGESGLGSTETAGLLGATGARGADGANGSNGANGDGTDGTNGKEGTPGRSGNNGADGTNGTGANGLNGTGTNGTDGTNGTNGTGTNGTNGTNGIDGASVT